MECEMFIYKISVLPLGDKGTYIGFDTKETRLKYRWKQHIKSSMSNPKQVIHKMMNLYGIDNCSYEVIEEGFGSISELALAEIRYIEIHDSYHNGLNSTQGGDGFGRSDLSSMDDVEYERLKEMFKERMITFNETKWSNTSKKDRKKMTSHLHTKDVYEKKSKTLKKYYEDNQDAAIEKYKAIENWRNENPEKLKRICENASAVAAEKNKKRLLTIDPNGVEKIYESKKEFRKHHGWIHDLAIEKTKQGKDHKGWKIWLI